MPSVFVSHGSPSLIVDGGPACDFLRRLGADLPRPQAIVCVSAHWDTLRPAVTGADRPTTIHDFYGFPRALYELRYPAPGDPALADRVAAVLQDAGFGADIDPARGLDHGVWTPLNLMYPAADVPTVQVSLQSHAGPAHHHAIGRTLAPLRAEGVLILGSGSATHNLGDFGRHSLDAPPLEYARAFDDWLRASIEAGDEEALIDYAAAAPHARRNHPSSEHLLPLFVALGAGAAAGRALFRGFTWGMLSMAAYAWA
jgi:4,5-DOPA dioxygenase extradiol